MEFIRSLKQLKPRHRGCVATIGNFDGVHLGHQSVFKQLMRKAEATGLPGVVISFEPQPLEFFNPSQSPPRLTRLREKLWVIKQLNVDRVLCLRFDARLAALDADAFVRQVLVNGLGVRHLIVGDDFHYGSQRSGNFSTLKAAGEQYGFELSRMETYQLDGARVSSTRVRAALDTGDMKLVKRLLGRPYTLSGRVAHGRQLGRQLGFPTANIHLHRKCAPIKGVFAVKVIGAADEYEWPGVANLGVRPTVDGAGQRPVLEVHLFDFNKNIYHRQVEVELITKLREEQKFASLDALKAQIQQDSAQARALFGLEKR